MRYLVCCTCTVPVRCIGSVPVNNLFLKMIILRQQGRIELTTDNSLFGFSFFGNKDIKNIIFMDPNIFGHKLVRFTKFFTTLQNGADSPSLSMVQLSPSFYIYKALCQSVSLSRFVCPRGTNIFDTKVWGGTNIFDTKVWGDKHF